MTYVGHSTVLRALSHQLPPVTLLTGPRSVGKWTLAKTLARHHNVVAADQLWFPDGVTAAAARQVTAFVSRAPFGTSKLVSIRLDRTSTAALNILLKTLEEPPAPARFILTAAKPVLPTIHSRAQVYRMGLLSRDEIETILIINCGFTPFAAARAAASSRGQVSTAIEAAGYCETTRHQVLSIARALASGDQQLFNRAFQEFDESSRSLFMIWLREVLTGQYAMFSAEDSYGLHADRFRLHAMLCALGSLANAGARLAVRAALEPHLTSRR